MPRRRRAVVLVSLSALALGALPSATSAVEADPVVFRIGATQAARPVELNPFRTTSGMGYGLIADRYDLLVGFGEDLSPASGLAERWDISEDGLTWTYHIRQGATWQDGQPVSADDVAFT
ncbi:MAG: ABC transporter substrate-binding protein, partial [Chloroflexota bacterium]|nr:ABC transporter substrate-binding protein [Chloroflexota bacterium]